MDEPAVLPRFSTQPWSAITVKPTAEFDRFATSYESELNQAISVSGETRDFFAESRVVWVGSVSTNLVSGRPQFWTMVVVSAALLCF
jgi:hypothetical protein